MGAVVNGVRMSGDTALSVYEADTSSSLSWIHLIRMLAFIWEELVSNHHLKDVDFEMVYDGSKVDEGYMWNYTLPRTSMVVSRSIGLGWLSSMSRRIALLACSALNEVSVIHER